MTETLASGGTNFTAITIALGIPLAVCARRPPAVRLACGRPPSGLRAGAGRAG